MQKGLRGLKLGLSSLQLPGRGCAPPWGARLQSRGHRDRAPPSRDKGGPHPGMGVWGAGCSPRLHAAEEETEVLGGGGCPWLPKPPWDHVGCRHREPGLHAPLALRTPRGVPGGPPGQESPPSTGPRPTSQKGGLELQTQEELSRRRKPCEAGAGRGGLASAPPLQPLLPSPSGGRGAVCGLWGHAPRQSLEHGSGPRAGGRVGSRG